MLLYEISPIDGHTRPSIGLVEYNISFFIREYNVIPHSSLRSLCSNPRHFLYSDDWSERSERNEEYLGLYTLLLLMESSIPLVKVRT